MQYIISSAGVKVPKIIYGTAWKKERTTELVVKAVQVGFRGIDTACQPKHYSEAGVGKALRILKTQGYKRENLYIQTKFTPLSGQDKNNVPYDKDASLSTQVAESFEVSKRNLQTYYVDSLVLHSPLFPHADLVKVWRAMEFIQKAGGALQLGISNCYDLEVLKRLYEDVEIKPSVVQNRFYKDSDYDVELREWCNAHNIIYQSFWSLTANPNILEDESLISIAKKHNKTQAQIFFAFLIHMGIVPLTGTTSELHMKEDLNAVDILLEDIEIANISKLLY